MSNLTITIDDDLLRTARVKAVQQGTSVNEVCRQAIAAFAQQDDDTAAERARARAKAFWDLSDQIANAAKAKKSSNWNLSRDAMYEEMFAEKSPVERQR